MCSAGSATAARRHELQLRSASLETRTTTTPEASVYGWETALNLPRHRPRPVRNLTLWPGSGTSGGFLPKNAGRNLTLSTPSNGLRATSPLHHSKAKAS